MKTKAERVICYTLLILLAAVVGAWAVAAPAPAVVRPCSVNDQRAKCPPATCGLGVTWDASPGATRYEVRRRFSWAGIVFNDKTFQVPVGRFATRTFDLRDLGAVKGRPYQIAVRACNAVGCGGWSDEDVWWRVPKVGECR